MVPIHVSIENKKDPHYMSTRRLGREGWVLVIWFWGNLFNHVASWDQGFKDCDGGSTGHFFWENVQAGKDVQGAIFT